MAIVLQKVSRKQFVNKQTGNETKDAVNSKKEEKVEWREENIKIRSEQHSGMSIRQQNIKTLRRRVVSAALSIGRVLVIMSRERKPFRRVSERKNFQSRRKLFLAITMDGRSRPITATMGCARSFTSAFPFRGFPCRSRRWILSDLRSRKSTMQDSGRK